jgi:hypothetical protein
VLPTQSVCLQVPIEFAPEDDGPLDRPVSGSPAHGEKSTVTTAAPTNTE